MKCYTAWDTWLTFTTTCFCAPRLWERWAWMGLLGNDEGLGGGSITYQSIWLGAPGLTDLSLGWWNQSTSTDVSTHWDQQALPDPAPPPLFPLSTQPMCCSKELSPALRTVQLLFKRREAITYECSNSSVQVIALIQKTQLHCLTRCPESLSLQWSSKVFGWLIHALQNNVQGMLFFFWNDRSRIRKDLSPAFGQRPWMRERLVPRTYHQSLH